MNVIEALFMGVLCALVGILIGWTEAHSTVATECQRLGAFYVGSKTFQCEVTNGYK